MTNLDLNNIHPMVRAGVDVGGVGLVINAIMQWTTPFLTFLGLLLAVLWYAAQLYESVAVQKLIAKWEVRMAIRHMPTAVAVIKALPDHAVEHMPSIEQNATLGAMVEAASAPPQSPSEAAPEPAKP